MRSALLDLRLANEEELIGDVKVVQPLLHSPLGGKGS